MTPILMTRLRLLARPVQRPLLLGLAVAGLAVAILGWPGRSVSKSSVADGVVAQSVLRADLVDEIAALGTLQPLRSVEVGTQISGQLRRLHVQLGQTVPAQALLAELDPTLLQARVDASRAGLRHLQAQWLDRSVQAELAMQQWQRNRSLIRAEAVSEELLQASSAAARSSAAQVQALAAQIAQAEANLGADEASLRATRIHAPMAGTVVAINAREGQTLVANQQAPVIVRIADLGRMTVWAQVTEADVPHIRLGMPVSFSTLGEPHRRWQGQVRQVLPMPESVNNVVLYQVLFDVDNPDGALRPQMSAQVSFVRQHAEGALVVPRSALQGGTGEAQAPSKVQVLHDDGRLEARTVQLGVVTRSRVQVVAGLAEGERVVTAGGAAGAARDGADRKAAKPAQTTTATTAFKRF
ncbi:efflux RND transporter periplasmic adaptor subunit [Sphaerotilus mobilis]|uniref:Macrolide-specific efflux system membrane fusion protein n=1 Tax=Sphaerotilus mobilis TaxID=47994 RepID=A0A4Q7LR10_9BURK|nr:efflux RND transporter periplasmic adaptor subunit [Sphaerotilus mobilis]RZS56831.1 macrolide-specific efflux system membrane fusion protein [Sphaerotilus mobilis]